MGKVKRLLAILFKTTELTFVFLSVFCILLFLKPLPLPGFLVRMTTESFVPSDLILRIESSSFGFMDGLRVSGFRLYDRARKKDSAPVISVDEIRIQPFHRLVTLRRPVMKSLHDSYYEPGNAEKNTAVEFSFPEIGSFALRLEEPEILGVTPSCVMADITVGKKNFVAQRISLSWTNEPEKTFLDGSTVLSLDSQEVSGEVRGFVKQYHIRPLLVALDIPSALPYIDAFTEVKGCVPSSCSWKVNLVNNDFDMELDLRPLLGKYNGVPMTRADGKLFLHVYTRGRYLNYSHVFGPIKGTGLCGEPLQGTVYVDGSNGWNKVRVEAESLLPVADLLKIGGFTGDYVSREVTGDSKCSLLFHFPRDKADDPASLGGKGTVSVENGQLMRMKGFTGLIEKLADTVPGFSLLTDSTDASCSYTIEKGVVKTDDLYIEGSVFSIKMYGSYDSAADKLDFTVRVQFMKKDSFAGKVLHSLAWPFTKLLLEYRLTGSSSEPKWEYISVIDRLTGGSDK